MYVANTFNHLKLTPEALKVSTVFDVHGCLTFQSFQYLMSYRKK
jgi:hypothetical protein